MSIDRIEMRNITVFRDLSMDFSRGANIIIGQNGTGKSTLLKFIYAACEWSNETTHKDKAKNIYSYFSYGKKNTDLLKSHTRDGVNASFKAISGNEEFEFNLYYDAFVDFETWIKLKLKSVFIPTTEMLSHSKGFLALNQKYEMPFDATQIDIIVNAELPETREISPLNKSLLDKISNIIGGEVLYENDTFYIMKENGMKVEFSFEAEGFRKFGLLWKLIRNGLIEEGTILLWDEPEANINPELMPVLVDILLELQRNGVQLFIATHSYNLAKYFELKRADSDKVEFHNLYKTNDGIKGQKALYLDNIENNPLEEWRENYPDITIKRNL
jgi:predicted ATPase